MLSDADLAAIRERIEKAKNWKADEMFVTADGSRIQWADPDDPSNPYTVASSAYTDDEVNVDGAAFLRLALAAFRSQPRLVAEIDRLRAKETESEWEYGWEASDASRRANRLATGYMGPRVMWDDTPHTPEEIAAFSHDQRIRRRKAGPIEPVEAGESDG